MTISPKTMRFRKGWTIAVLLLSMVDNLDTMVGANETAKTEPVEFDREAVLKKLDAAIDRAEDAKLIVTLIEMRQCAFQQDTRFYISRGFLNKLKVLPPEIGQLMLLSHLRIRYGDLTKLPPEIGNLSELTDLEIVGNQLTAIPPEIGNLAKLKKMYFFNNKLTTLPPEIAKLVNLTELHLNSNQLATLPFGITKLSKLEVLSLENNPLPDSVLNDLKSMKSLRFLKLKGTKITKECITELCHALPECEIGW